MTIPIELQDAINDWFDTRYICDNTSFTRFFRRVLERDYRRYQQILRLEPGVSQYDWLVQKYEEAQRYSKAEDERARTDTGKSSGIRTHDRSSGSNSTETRNDTNTRSMVTGENSTGSETRTPNLKSVETGSSVTDNKRVPNLTVTTDRKKSDIITLSGQDRATTTTSGKSGSRSVAKQNPQSISYPNFTQEPDGDEYDASEKGWHVPRLDWKYPGTQAQDKSKSEGSSTTTTNPGTITTTTHTGQPDTVATTGSEETNNTQSDTRARTDTGTENRSTESGTKRDLSETAIGNGSVSRNSTETGKDTDISSEERSSDSSETGSRQSLDREVRSGRGESPAVLLKRAKEYIKSTSALMWLCGQLEVCFIGCYEV